MTRGRHPDQGRALAEPVAKRRGVVNRIAPGQDSLLDLVITGSGIFYTVTIRRTHRLRASLPEIEAEFGGLISEVRQLPGGEPVSREIWWYNRAGHLRFFRVDATGLVELAADGSPLSDKPKNNRRKKQVSQVAPGGEVPKDSVREVAEGSVT